MYRLVIVDGMPVIVPDQINDALDAGATVKGLVKIVPDQTNDALDAGATVQELAKAEPCPHCQRGTSFLVLLQGDETSRSEHRYCLNCGEKTE
jgi:hypothetical protein